MGFPLKTAVSPELLAELQRGQCPDEPTKPCKCFGCSIDALIQRLSALRRTRAMLAVKAKDNNLDVTFRSRIVSIVGL